MNKELQKQTLPKEVVAEIHTRFEQCPHEDAEFYRQSALEGAEIYQQIAALEKHLKPQGEPVGYLIDGCYYSNQDFAGKTISERTQIIDLYASPVERCSEIERLKDAIKKEQSGLAAALAECVKIAQGYEWLSEGRGPYSFDDEAYKTEAYRLCTDIGKVAYNALSKAGIDANKALHDVFTESASPVEVKPTELHPDSARLLNDFMEALTEKMIKSQRKYGYSNHWLNKDWREECTTEIVNHLAKGDPKDVAIYAAFMWYHNRPTLSPSQKQQQLAFESLAELRNVAQRYADKHYKGDRMHWGVMEGFIECGKKFIQFPIYNFPSAPLVFITEFPQWQSSKDLVKKMRKACVEGITGTKTYSEICAAICHAEVQTEADKAQKLYEALEQLEKSATYVFVSHQAKDAYSNHEEVLQESRNAMSIYQQSKA